MMLGWCQSLTSIICDLDDRSRICKNAPEPPSTNQQLQTPPPSKTHTFANKPEVEKPQPAVTAQQCGCVEFGEAFPKASSTLNMLTLQPNCKGVFKNYIDYMKYYTLHQKSIGSKHYFKISRFLR